MSSGFYESNKQGDSNKVFHFLLCPCYDAPCMQFQHNALLDGWIFPRDVIKLNRGAYATDPMWAIHGDTLSQCSLDVKGLFCLSILVQVRS
jgi:hypothetical protein